MAFVTTHGAIRIRRHNNCYLFYRALLLSTRTVSSGISAVSGGSTTSDFQTSTTKAKDIDDRKKWALSPSLLKSSPTATTFNSINNRILIKTPTKAIRSYSSTKNNSNAAAAKSSMKDEYGDMNSDGHTYTYHNGDYILESGAKLNAPVQLRYQTYGTLNEETRDNVLVICHALTGNASLHSWWGNLLGPDKAFDTSKYFIVCCNVLGSCYGSTSPQSINEETGIKYGKDFPNITVQDNVRLQLELLKNELQVSSIKCVIGGSYGGMQAIEFAMQGGYNDAPFTKQLLQTTISDKIDDDDNDNRNLSFESTNEPFVRSVVPIACGPAHSAWQIAISEVQRQMIYADPNWAFNPDQATSGLAVARQMGMISYRTAKGYDSRFGRQTQDDGSTTPASSPPQWTVQSYLEYQGQKFLNRFDPVTYVKLTEQMDTHDVGRNRGNPTNSNNDDDNSCSSTTSSDVKYALSKVTIPSLVLGINSDVLYPLSEQEAMADMLPNGKLGVIDSDDGHDGFLLEQDQVASHINDFLNSIE